MAQRTYVSETAADSQLVPWLQDYLIARDTVIYDDVAFLERDLDFDQEIAEVNARYREQFAAHGLLVDGAPERSNDRG
jgi:hypothetical protein